MPTSIVEKKENDIDIFRSPVLYDKPQQIQKVWNTYREKTLGDNKMLTRDGVCFALKIFRNEWDKLREHETLGLAIEWIEQQIADDWQQELVKTGHAAGALAYLKAHYPNLYGETAVVNIGNMNLSVLLVKAHEKLQQQNEQ